MPGYPLPRLHRVALLGHSLTFPTGTTGPPEAGNAGSGKTYPLRPFYNAVVTPAAKVGLPPSILYGVTGTRPNTSYPVAGVMVKYELGGKIFEEPVYNGGVACVEAFKVDASLSQQRACYTRFKPISKAWDSMRKTP